ncbi:lactoylglutathione lyase [Rhizobium sp. Leaf391]|uniref:VOC family protein n=1 Tax=Rhizobium sp. Leaf391 TaxID=1736360 RepID=UPI000715C4DD|nr:VOC family protein [Rhizobium sp. Leaf391]KQT05166.1 lactoylglutathione lyase [Rhizobium sp. Leaf391]
MPDLALHHVSIITSDLELSLPFYRDVFGLTELSRPDFPVGGAWLSCGRNQVHLVVHPGGSFRRNAAIARNDWHFAFNTDDFEGVLERLSALGFSSDVPAGDPKHMLVFRTGLAGFPQLYLRDPDYNVVEINGAA